MKSDKSRRRLYRIISFLIPVCCMAVCYALLGVLPFGSNLPFTGDARDQYLPFFGIVRKALREGGSLLWSWRAGLGTNLWAMISYYCASPWNLPAVFLPDSAQDLYFSLLICVRLGLGGWCMSVLLQTIDRRPQLSVSVFSVMYALCTWLVGNYFQFIWSDTVTAAPLVLAGLILLVRDRDCRLYVLALAWAVLCNPYIGYIVCLMTVLCWLALLFILRRPLRTLPGEAGRFAGCSLLGGGFGAVFYLPMAFALRDTYATGEGFPALDETIVSYPGVLGRLLTNSEFHSHTLAPNIACGMLAVFLVGGFLTARRISVRERIAGLLMTALLTVSLWYVPLNYVWHGFHSTNGYPFRYAFLVPLVLCCIGFRYTALGCPEEGDSGKAKGRAQGTIGAGCTATKSTDVPLLSAAAVGVYFLLYLAFGLRPSAKKALSAVLCAAVTAELLLNAYLTMQNPIYASQGAVRDDAMTAAAETAADCTPVDQPARIGMPSDETIIPENYDIRCGTNLVSSLMPQRLTQFCDAVGMGAQPDWTTYVFRPLSPLSMQLLNVHTLIEPRGTFGLNTEDYSPAAGEAEQEEYGVYRFTKAIGTGFLTAAQEAPAMLQESSRLLIQNAIFTELTGITEPLYTEIPLQRSEGRNAEITQNGAQCWHLVTEDDKRTRAVFYWEVPEDGEYYLDVLPDDTLKYSPEETVVAVDQESVAGWLPDTNHMFYWKGGTFALGMLKKGQTVMYLMQRPGAVSADLRLMLGRLDRSRMEEGRAYLAQAPLLLNSCSDSALSGTVTAGHAGMLYLSVPYDKGWHAAVDGEQAELLPAFGGMSCLRIEEGCHAVSMHFMPQGLTAGAYISVFSAVGILVLLTVQTVTRRKTRKKQDGDA